MNYFKNIQINNYFEQIFLWIQSWRYLFFLELKLFNNYILKYDKKHNSVCKSHLSAAADGVITNVVNSYNLDFDNQTLTEMVDAVYMNTNGIKANKMSR